MALAVALPVLFAAWLLAVWPPPLWYRSHWPAETAFQAMRRNGILRIATDVEDTFVTVTFADTGSGISPESMSKIFEPYYTTKASGTGLGLLIVRRIVREHGGEIELMSDEGKGLTLTIRLPLHEKRLRMLGPGEPVN